MKKIVLLLSLPFVFIATLSAQIITQDKANGIIWQRMINETEEFTVFVKKGVQPKGSIITTSSGEVIELDYSCWIYYVHYPLTANSKYLIVREIKGNLLEVNAKNDEGPADIENWKNIPIKVCGVDNPLTDLPWLEAIVQEFENAQDHTRIDQCIYKDGVCFLICFCVNCSDITIDFKNCSGELLCVYGGIIGNPCTELEFDRDTVTLIFEKKP